MVYVARFFSRRVAICEADKFIEENASHIKKVDKRFMPIKVEFANSDSYLFMTTHYYENHFKIGRHKGLDYKCI